jgi:predicted nucleic acid-binding Zn ribbon protein
VSDEKAARHRPGVAQPGSGGPPAGPDVDAAAPGARGTGGGGTDAVRAALNRARAAAASRGVQPGAPADVPRSRRRRVAGEARRSGAYPDARDPQTVASSIERLVAERGWGTPVAIGGVIGRWEAVVGTEFAAHCRPESFTDGVLAVRTDSTAWATQLRLLLPNLLRRLAEEVGESTVHKVVIRGPVAPSWRRGSRVAPGSQGPRDTYG